MKIFAGTVVGHGGVRLEGTAIFITSDTTAATIVGHDLGIQVNVSGGTQLGFHANSTGTYPGTAAFKADGDWVYGFDGGGLDLINLGNLFGHQHIVGQDVGLYIQGYKSGGNSWFMQTVDATGLFRIYAATTGGDRYSISQASTATHTFAGNASITGSTTISGLAGTGSRTVVASSAGLLSAPVSDSRLKRNITPIAKEVDVLALLEDSEIRGVFYDWKDATLGTEREIGFTAQMFEEIPGLTGSMSDTGHAYLNYERITALLWEQNRLLLAQNKALSERIRALENGTQLR